MDSKARLSKIIEHLGINANKLAKSLGMERAQGIYDVLNGKADISGKLASKMVDAYPQLNTEWLLSGKGDMLKRSAKKGEAVPLEVRQDNLMYVPVVNHYAYAGYLRGYGDAEYLESLPKIPWLIDKEYKGTYMAFEVRGDSMDDNSRDSYVEGDKILCREINKEHWKSKLHIRDWDFVIVHKTEGILIKRIIKHDVAKGTLLLHSLNDLYEDFTVNLADVAKIFNVVQVSRKK
jgi:phage repressor protein C with HTH and peptisase S24 domain